MEEVYFILPTPIARYNVDLYELDLVLRNNRVTKERPYGLFHSREEYHNIKRENIGLIEAMGLAVLPSRLKGEIEEIKGYLLKEELQKIKYNEYLNKHYNLAMMIHEKYKINNKNINKIIEKEIGDVFLNMLKDAGVFKDTVEGQFAFKKCMKKLLLNL